MNQSERLSYLKKITGLSAQDIAILHNPSSAFSFDNANTMIENAIGILTLPLGIATNFVINGKEYLVPMAIEEPSIIAAASNAAKLARSKGGFKASAKSSIMRGQIQVIKLLDIKKAMHGISKHRDSLLKLANSVSKNVKALDLKSRVVDNEIDGTKMVVTEIYVDCKDSMGANTINTMCELLGPRIEQKTGGKVVLKILSNYATERIAISKATFKKQELGGDDIV